MLFRTPRRRLSGRHRTSHARRLSSAGGLAILLGVASGLLGGLAAPASSFGFPPVNISPPTITGAAQQGQTLTEVHGSWDNFPMSYTYQWQRCNSSGTGCSSISGANAQTHVLVAEDVGHRLSVKETASNFSGSGSPAESSATAVVLPLVPENTSAPTITGTAQQGQTLSEVHGSWTNSPTGYAYQWLRCDSSGAGCSSVSGAVAQTYAPVSADVGHRLRLKETAGNAGGSGSAAQSAATAVVSSAAPAADPPAARPAPPPLVISISSADVDRHGNALIPVQCPASAAGGCRGKITITVQVSAARGKRASAARCARGCRPLGSTNYEARAGQKVRVRVHIASLGRRLLKQHSSVRVTLTATSVSGGQTASVTRAISLKRGARA